jgi:ankyrin repeat protein
MLERKRLKLDPSFADKFFEIANIEREDDELSAALNFSLPASYETFAAFQSSGEGKNFQIGVCDLIDKLYVLADKVTDEFTRNVAAFKTNHILIDGKDLGLNINDFALYEKGIPYLACVVKMLQDASIPLSLRVDTARNLLSEIGKCGPGDSTQIARAYRVLKASQSLPSAWLKFRSDVAEQVLVCGIKEIRGQIWTGNDIHHINAIMNHFSDVLGLRTNTDVLITVCSQSALGFLYEYFIENFPKQLTLENLFDIIIDSLDLNGWMSLLLKRQEEIIVTNDRAPFNDVAKMLEEKLNRYGVSCFSFSDLCIMSDDGVNVLTLTCHAKAILYLDLRARLIDSQFFVDLPYTQLGSVPGCQVYVLPEKSLQLAYLLDGGIKKPFLPGFLEAFFAADERWIEYYLALNSHPHRKQELATTIFNYFNSENYSVQPICESLADHLILILALMDATHWFTYSRQLPKNLARIYFKYFLNQYLTNDDLTGEITNFYFTYKYVHHEILINAIIKAIPMSQAFDSYQRSMLHVVSGLNYPEMTRALIANGGDIDIPDSKGCTPLMRACYKEAIKIVNVLVELGADVNLCNYKGETALHAACQQLNADVVKVLLSATANVDEADLLGVTALHHAINFSTLAIVNLLIDAHANVNAVSFNGESVLSTAIKTGEWQKVQALLAAGARLDLTRSDTVLLLAILKAFNYPPESVSILSLLVDNYIEDLAARVSNVANVSEGPHLSPAKIKFSAKVASAARLFSLIEGEGRDVSPRNSDGLPKVSWKTACDNSKRMRFFVQTYENLVDKGVLPDRVDFKF